MKEKNIWAYIIFNAGNIMLMFTAAMAGYLYSVGGYREASLIAVLNLIGSLFTLHMYGQVD